MFGSKETDSTTNEEKKAILDFDGKKYLIFSFLIISKDG